MKKIAMFLCLSFFSVKALAWEPKEFMYDCTDESGSVFSLRLTYAPDNDMTVSLLFPGEPEREYALNEIDIVWQSQFDSLRVYFRAPGDDEQNNVCLRSVDD